MAAVIGPLRYIIKVIPSPGVQGGKALALCTEDGQPVGKQIETSVCTGVGDIGVLTVRFYVDGDDIRFADNDG